MSRFKKVAIRCSRSIISALALESLMIPWIGEINSQAAYLQKPSSSIVRSLLSPSSVNQAAVMPVH